MSVLSALYLIAALLLLPFTLITPLLHPHRKTIEVNLFWDLLVQFSRSVVSDSFRLHGL